MLLVGMDLGKIKVANSKRTDLGLLNQSSYYLRDE